jgi:diguanylate cyclase (GGDEF)-like protein/PAS domain S-box-containing protein
MISAISSRLRTANLWLFTGLAIVFSEIITAIMNTIMSQIWLGQISLDLLLIGCVDAFVVAALVAPILIRLFKDAANLADANAILEREITERKQVEAALRESEERYTLAVQGANDGLWDWNLKTGAIFFSSRWKTMIGYRDDEITNRPEEWLERVHPDDRNHLQEDIAAHLAGQTAHLESEYRILHLDGAYRWMLCRGFAVRDLTGKAYRMAGSQTDISLRKIIEERLVHDALHDALTGFPNRALFMDRLAQAIQHTKRHAGQPVYAVLFLDLDRFKVVNDSLGHAAGDQFLITVAQLLKECLRSADTIARLGGDEFAIVLHEIEDVNDAVQVAERMLHALANPLSLNGRTVAASTSIGIAMGNGNEQPEEILRDADTAMYRAKSLGRARYAIFDPSMHARAMALLQMESDLRHALECEEFEVYYQPIISISSGEIIGAEALVRWWHPQRGTIPPAEFIPIAEETGLIIPIGEWILRNACAQARTWRAAGYLQFRISVNFSARQFQDINLPNLIRQALQDTELPAAALDVEITEGIAMQDINATVQILRELNAMGIRISLDDFGNGYSALGYLRRYPIHTLKIDRSFVQDVSRDSDNAAITAAIIAVAHQLDLMVVAEGVETEEQLAFLRSLGCDAIQGFLFSRAVPASELSRLLQEHKPYISRLPI